MQGLGLSSWFILYTLLGHSYAVVSRLATVTVVVALAVVVAVVIVVLV